MWKSARFCVALLCLLIQVGSAQDDCVSHDPDRVLTGVTSYRRTTVGSAFECLTECLDDDRCKAAIHRLRANGERVCRFFAQNSETVGVDVIVPTLAPGESTNLYQQKTSCNNAGKWTEWGPWGDCPAACDESGTASRSRSCVGGTCSEGAAGDYRDCVGSCIPSTPPSFPSGPSYSAWTQWAPCNTQCGNGVQTRTRTCTTGNCGINPRQSEEKPCSVPCTNTYGYWEPWEQCTQSCGGGTRMRKRSCNADPSVCGTGTMELALCSSNPCTDSSWTQWLPWGRCSVSCGQGVVSRRRQCTSGVCDGRKDDTQPCDAGPCPDYGTWGEWSRCSASCGNGTQVSTRTCRNGLNCNGPKTKSRPCTGQSCQSITGWSPFGPWSVCSVTCGQGYRERKKQCLSATRDDCPGKDREFQVCRLSDCSSTGSSAGREWSDCSVTCGSGVRTRRSWSGDLEEQKCNPGSCDCSATCGLGKHSRLRSCSCNSQFGDCPGDSNEQVACSSGPCSMWQPWSRWSDCSLPCQHGDGLRTRTRACVNGDLCRGNGIETKSCDQCSSGSGPGSISPFRGGPGAPGLVLVVTGPEVGQFPNKKSPAPGFGSPDGPPSPPTDPSFYKEFCDLPQWTGWSAWGLCSSSGLRRRGRTCVCGPKISAFCPGAALGEQICSSPRQRRFKISLRDRNRSQSGLSKNSGNQSLVNYNGTQSSSRQSSPEFSAISRSFQWRDLNPSPENAEDACHWAPWSACSSSCGPGLRNRRKISRNPNLVCANPEMQDFRSCDQGSCPTWSQWSNWSPCSASCDIGRSERVRTCSHGSSSCDGESWGSRECRQTPCRSDCQWAMWEPWGPCSTSPSSCFGVAERWRRCPCSFCGEDKASESGFCRNRACFVPPSNNA